MRPQILVKFIAMIFVAVAIATITLNTTALMIQLGKLPAKIKPIIEVLGNIFMWLFLISGNVIFSLYNVLVLRRKPLSFVLHDLARCFAVGFFLAVDIALMVASLLIVVGIILYPILHSLITLPGDRAQIVCGVILTTIALATYIRLTRILDTQSPPSTLFEVFYNAMRNQAPFRDYVKSEVPLITTLKGSSTAKKLTAALLMLLLFIMPIALPIIGAVTKPPVNARIALATLFAFLPILSFAPAFLIDIIESKETGKSTPFFSSIIMLHVFYVMILYPIYLATSTYLVTDTNTNVATATTASPSTLITALLLYLTTINYLRCTDVITITTGETKQKPKKT